MSADSRILIVYGNSYILSHFYTSVFLCRLRAYGAELLAESTQRRLSLTRYLVNTYIIYIIHESVPSRVYCETVWVGGCCERALAGPSRLDASGRSGDAAYGATLRCLVIFDSQ